MRHARYVLHAGPRRSAMGEYIPAPGTRPLSAQCKQGQFLVSQASPLAEVGLACETRQFPAEGYTRSKPPPFPLPPVIVSPSAADYSPTTQLTHPRSPQYTIQSRPNPHKSKMPVYVHCRPVTWSQVLSPWQLPKHQRQMSMTQRRV